MSIKGFKVNNQVERYDYEYLDNIPLVNIYNIANGPNLVGMDIGVFYPFNIPNDIKVTFSRSDGLPFGSPMIKYGVFDENKELIDWFNINPDTTVLTKTFPADTRWFSWQAGTTLPSNIMVNIGEDAEPYVPYRKEYLVNNNSYSDFDDYQKCKKIAVKDFEFGAIDSQGGETTALNRLRTKWLENCILYVSSVSNNYNINVYDENKNWKYVISTSGDTVVDLTKNDYCHYARIDISASATSHISITYESKTVSDIYETEFQTKNDLILFDDLWEDGEFSNAGAEKNSDSMARTGYISANQLYIKTAGLYNVYIFKYKADHSFIGSTSINESQYLTIGDTPSDRTQYVRLTTRRENLLSSSFYKVDHNYSQTSFNISPMYEAGTFSYPDGAIRSYARATLLSSYRIVKFLKVIPSTTITISYPSGTVYLYQYDKDKTNGYGQPFQSGSTINLASTTEYVRFEHGNYVLGDAVTVTIFGDEKWEYANRLNSDPIAFGYEVFPSFGTDIPSSKTALDSERVFTSGFLMLPPNYTDTGEKVPIIYFAHGSGDYGSITSSAPTSHYLDYYHYLCDEGYALFDCFGLTDRYGNSGNPMANPTCLAAIRQGLEWVCKNFNVDINSVYVTGKSLGGIPALAMCYDSGVHVKACAPLAPEIDSISIGLGYNEDTRKAVAADLGFEPANDPSLEEEGAKMFHAFDEAYKTYVLNNVSKISGYDPMYSGLIGVDIEELATYWSTSPSQGYGARTQVADAVKILPRICFVPTKIFIAVDDPAVSYLHSQAYIQSIKNAGFVGELRTFPANTGGHHAVDTDENAPKVSSITTSCGIVHTNVPLAYAEMVQFFRRFK